ncbi:MAG: hypothetical protein LUQ01_03210 [Methanolinea sp.]|nr:hypothetical protein [Methanolinea sp.]
MEIWFIIGIVAALLTTFGFIPQILKMYRTRSVGDVSLATFVQFLAGVGLWIFYGMAIRDPIVTVANTVTFATLIAAITLYWIYHGRASTSG